MTPATGASPEQIEAAAKRWYDHEYAGSLVVWEEQSIDIQSYWCAAMHKMAAFLVDADHRIVSVDDLP